MSEWILKRCGCHYILAMMVLTRLIGSVGGALTIYYVNLTLDLPPRMHHRFVVAAAFVVVLAVALTIVTALVETRALRRVLRRLERGEEVDAADAAAAGRQAVLFPGRHHLHEAIVVPLCTTVPVCILLAAIDQADVTVLVHITIATFLGISTSLLSTFFVIERWMQPVVRHLLDSGIRIDYSALPMSRLRLRLSVSVGLMITITALMIGKLASQRAADIIDNPEHQAEAVVNLQQHTTYISVAAVTVGLLLSHVLAHSVASRARNLMQAMKRVEAGCLTERVQAPGNDEIDILARQFNAMVGQLYQHDHTIRDLNANLEVKVKHRTRQLSKSKHEVARSLRKLQEHDRLKTEFFSNVSHELRTPLTMILAPVDRVLEKHGTTLGSDVSSMLDVVRINGRRLLELINRLLEFSKLEAGRAELKLSAVDLNRRVSELATAARPLAEQRQLQLRVDCDGELPAFAADQEKIDIVLSNLLSNAMKFTPKGGTIRVETAREGDQARVSVSDTGMGIAKADQERIFERFVQLDGSASREFAGTGLGLALVKELIELHKGQIHVTSEPGNGTRFWFYVPLISVPAVAPAGSGASARGGQSYGFSDLVNCETGRIASVPATRAAPAGAAKILVADDTPEMRALLGDILCEQYEVLFAQDGGEGSELAMRELPDLIISDVMMPGVDGYEFCRRVKAHPKTRPIPFVMLTARAERSLKIEGLELGADDYLVKPFDAEELRARVRSLLKLRRLHQDLDQRNAELERTLGELRQAQSQLVHSEKMNAVGQLVAGIAHEINNAINAVYNGVQPLRAKTKRLEELVLAGAAAKNGANDPASTRREIETAFSKIWVLADAIGQGATRAARIVSDLKTFSHPGSEPPALFDLHETLDMCANLLCSQTKHRITLRKDYGNARTLYGPRGQLSQVFMNLLNNAQQAIAGSGEITIRTRQQGERVVVSIRDTGHGIPEEIKRKIFDPFFTTKPPGVGTGLGLSISYGLVTKLGGTIEFQSEIGQGTEFIVTLPSAKVPVAASSGGEWVETRQPPALEEARV